VAAGAGTKLVCPVMKGPIEDPAKAPRLLVNNETVLFCCGACSDPVKKEPERYLTSPLKDPVTGESFKVTKQTPHLEREGALFLFASDANRKTFEKDPAAYTKPPAAAPSS
jgi:YHS domain-containing protein